jgi:hypothetical protein
MYPRISLLCIGALSLLSQAAAVSGAELCSDKAFSQDLSRVKEWKGFHHLYLQYLTRCSDDGFYAEGYSGAVAELLTKNWTDLLNLQSLTSHDTPFRNFVLKHIDATADREELSSILKKARSNCPATAMDLCRAIEGRALAASRQ